MRKKGILLATVLGLVACQPVADVDPTTNAIANFDYIWTDFDQMYGSFARKGIDWQAVYRQYRPQLTDQSSSADLYRVLKPMIDVLKDPHVSIVPTDPRLKRYSSGEDQTPILNRTSLELIQTKYLREASQATPEIGYGMLSGNIGYLYIRGFEGEFSSYEPVFDTILTYLQHTRGLVLDIRDHWGGRDEIGQYVAGRFTQQAYLYIKSRKRNGPSQTYFTPWQEWYVKPTGTRQYTKPIIVLTSDDTASAAETFTLAMKRLPHVRQVGLNTSGAISDKATREMPNGWQFTLSIGEYLDHQGMSWESKGIPPDVRIANTDPDLQNQQDLQLEKAMQLVK